MLDRKKAEAVKNVQEKLVTDALKSYIIALLFHDVSIVFQSSCLVS